MTTTNSTPNTPDDLAASNSAPAFPPPTDDTFVDTVRGKIGDGEPVGARVEHRDHSTDSGLRRFEEELMVGGAVDTEPEPVGGLQAVVGMSLIFGLFVWLGTINVWYAVFAVAVLIAIFLHEVGHFVTARWTGMKATQFFIGFGPRVWSFQRGETEYGVRALPLGAFVRIIGMNRYEEVPPEDESRTYRVKSFPRRLLVISAGSIMHMLIAIAVLFGVYTVDGRRVEVAGAATFDDPAAVSGAAADAGVQPGDVIVGVGGVAIDGPLDLGEAVRSHPAGTTVEFRIVRGGPTVDNGGEIVEVPVTLQESFSSSDTIVSIDHVDVVDGDVAAAAAKFDDGAQVVVGLLATPTDAAAATGDGSAPEYTRGVIRNNDGSAEVAPTALAGLSTYQNNFNEQVGMPQAALHAVGDIGPNAVPMVKGVVGVFNPSNIVGHLAGTNDDIATRPTTLVGAGQVSAEVGEQQGLGEFFFLFAMLNIFIGVFNMFPLLPLDGGHAAIAVYERVRELLRGTRQRYYADVSKLMPFTMMVVLLLGFVFISGLYLDITRPL